MRLPYNILWIQTDEMRLDSLGCYGGDNLTPNIDWIAQEGVRFTRHFTNSPVCVPARVSELTSCYPARTGILENSVHYTWGRWPQNLITFPECFQQQGYATANFGKYHTPQHGTWGENWHFEHREDVGEFFGLKPCYDEKENEILHLGNRKNGVVIGGRYPVTETPTKIITDRAIEWLNSYQHVRRPFLLRVSYLAPHTPVMAPDPFYSQCREHCYNWDRPTPETLAGLPEYERRNTGDYLRHSEKDYQQMRRSYYSLVQHIDQQVGRLVQCLKEQGEYDNTIILFTSDHGDLMGEYGQFQKGIFYDLVTNVPCILKAPDLASGQVRDNLTECVDIGPTLLELCGLPVQSQFVGKNMLKSHKEEIISEILLGGCRRACIRNTEYCLDITLEREGIPVTPDQYDGKLISLKQDPDFHRNLFTCPEALQVREQLIQKLRRRIYENAVPIQLGSRPK